MILKIWAIKMSKEDAARLVKSSRNLIVFLYLGNELNFIEEIRSLSCNNSSYVLITRLPHGDVIFIVISKNGWRKLISNFHESDNN